MSHSFSRREFLKKTAALTVGATLTGPLLAACVQAPAGAPAASAGGSAAGSTPLTIWSIWDLDKEMKSSELFDSFTQQTGNKVEHTFVAGDGWQEKFNAGAAGKQLPDIFVVDGINIAAYGSRNLITPASDFVDQKILDDYWPGILGEVRWQGKHWGLSIELHSQGMVVNLDMLAEKGVKEVPKTWDEWVEMGKALTDEKAGVWGTNFPVGRNEYVAWWISLFIAQNGGSLLTEDGTKAAIDQAGAVGALQQLSDLVNVHKVAPGAAQIQAGPEGGFLGKRVASECTGSWNLLQWVKTPPPFKWTFAPVPHPAGKDDLQGIGGGWHFCQWKETKNPDQTAKLMNFLAGDEWMTAAADRFRPMSPRKSIAEKRDDLKKEPWSWAMAILQIGHANRPVHPQYPLITNAAQEAYDKIIIGKEAAQATMDQAAKAINDALANA